MKKLNDLIREVKIAMMTTQTFDGSLNSRPMVTQNRDSDGSLWFFTGKDSGKTVDIQANSRVNVAYASPDDNIYVSVKGHASLCDDQEKIDEFWSPLMRGWFPDGKEDDNLALIRVDVESAEYWHATDNTFVQLYSAIESTLTGERADHYPGDHAKLEMNNEPNGNRYRTAV